MKPTSLRFGKAVLVLATLLVTIGLVSWDQRYAPGRFDQSIIDTTPKKKIGETDRKVRDLDDVIDEMNKADLELDHEKIKAQIEDAFKGFDHEKIKKQMEEALKEVDMDKLKAEIDRSMAKLDMDKVKKQMELALKEVDMSKIQEEIKASMDKIDWNKMKADMDKVKEIDMKKMEADMDKMKDELKEIGPKLEKEMEKVKLEMEKAKAEMKEYKEFVDGLEKDGLINKKETYTIKHKDGELQINGKKADQKVYDKYRNFLEKHKSFNIEKSDDDFNIRLH